HDAPEVSGVAKRASLPAGGDTEVQILKTFHGGHGGKLSLARVLRGNLKDGAVLHGAGGREARIGGIFALWGDRRFKRNVARAGDTVALARLESFATGETLSTAKGGGSRMKLERLEPGRALARAGPSAPDE